MSDNDLLNANDLDDPAALVAKLRDVRDLVSEYIRNQLSSETRMMITSCDTNYVSQELLEHLVQDLRRMLTSPDFIDNIQRCGKVLWPEGARVEDCYSGHAMERHMLNKKVLVGIYPRAFGTLGGAPDNAIHVDKVLCTPSFELGPRGSHSMMHDPKHLFFGLARYKFCAKMLQGKASVLEVGCGDGIGAPIVAQVVENLLCVDQESVLIENNRKRFQPFRERFAAFKNIDFQVMDMINLCPEEQFDAVFSIDVIEHVPGDVEHIMMATIKRCLKTNGILIIGTPNITADKFSSEPGASPHCNLKSHDTLRQMLHDLFSNTLIFSMNDEIVHTGFYPMAHYLFGIGIGLRQDRRLPT